MLSALTRSISYRRGKCFLLYEQIYLGASWAALNPAYKLKPRVMARPPTYQNKKYKNRHVCVYFLDTFRLCSAVPVGYTAGNASWNVGSQCISRHPILFYFHF